MYSIIRIDYLISVTIIMFIIIKPSISGRKPLKPEFKNKESFIREEVKTCEAQFRTLGYKVYCSDTARTFLNKDVKNNNQFAYTGVNLIKDYVNNYYFDLFDDMNIADFVFTSPRTFCAQIYMTNVPKLIATLYSIPPILDGSFFKIVQSKDVSVTAECMMGCSNKQIKGAVNATSNFTDHLKSYHADNLSQYEEYKSKVFKQKKNNKKNEVVSNSGHSSEQAINYCIDEIKQKMGVDADEINKDVIFPKLYKTYKLSDFENYRLVTKYYSDMLDASFVLVTGGNQKILLSPFQYCRDNKALMQRLQNRT